MIESLRAQHANLLRGCDPAVCSSVRVELDAADKRIRNLEAALKTWYEFLAKMRNTFRLYEQLAQQIDDMFSKIQSAVEQERSNRLTYSIPAIQRRLLLLKVNDFFRFKEKFIDDIIVEFDVLELPRRTYVNGPGT